MTRAEILSMPAGREMDALIAQMLYPEAIEFYAFPNYSTNIKDAWEVVEKLRSRVNAFTIGASIILDNGWAVEWRNGDFVHDKSVPLAICKAALLAVTE